MTARQPIKARAGTTLSTLRAYRSELVWLKVGSLRRFSIRRWRLILCDWRAVEMKLCAPTFLAPLGASSSLLTTTLVQVAKYYYEKSLSLSKCANKAPSLCNNNEHQLLALAVAAAACNSRTQLWPSVLSWLAAGV